MQNEVPLQTNTKAIDLAVKNGVKVIYNAAPYKPLDSAIYQRIDIFNVNEIELEQYSGEKDYIKGVQKLTKLGLKKVLVTLGEKGSLLYDGNKFYKVDALKVEAVDTVGAGDTYVGYFGASIAIGMSEFDAIKVATKASSLTVSRKGSIISIPFGNEIINSKFHKFFVE